MNSATIAFRVKPEIKKRADALFARLGMTTSTGMNILLMLFPWFPNSTYKTILQDRPRHLANGNWTKLHLEVISTSHGSAARDLISNDPMHFLCFPFTDKFVGCTVLIASG